MRFGLANFYEGSTKSVANAEAKSIHLAQVIVTNVPIFVIEFFYLICKIKGLIKTLKNNVKEPYFMNSGFFQLRYLFQVKRRSHWER